MEQELIFPAGVPVSGKYLIDRKTELSDVINYMKAGQSMVLISPRRFGKTSLVLVAMEKLKREGYFTAEVDIFKVISKRELAEKITASVLKNKIKIPLLSNLKEGARSLLKQVKLKKVVFGGFEFIFDFADLNSSEDKLLEESLEFINDFAAKNKKRIIFFFDEFGDLAKLDGEAWLKKMRAIFQRHKFATYIFAGSQESIMNEIFANRKKPFFRFCRTMNLDRLPAHETKVYIHNSFEGFGFRLEKGIEEGILEAAKCHPYYIQLICQVLYFLKLEERKIEKSDINTAYRRAINMERQYFDQIWQNLKEKKNHLEILEYFLKRGGSPYAFRKIDRQSIYYVLTNLETMGILKKVKEGKYEMLDPLFGDYILMRNEM